MKMIEFYLMVKSIIIMSRITHLIVLISALVSLAFSATSSLYTISSYTYPGQVCSAYCMYEVNANMNYNPLCLGSYTLGNGYCTKCDPLLFRAVTGVGGGFNCIPHLYNSQEYAGGGTNLNYKFGYFQDSSRTWNNNALGAMPFQLTGLLPHFAIRIRFGIYLYYFQFGAYTYPIEYSIDGSSYTYDQDLSKYWSPYDIITSPLQDHTNDNAAISFRLTSLAYPYNSNVNCSYLNTNGLCQCYRGWPDYDCNGGANCCGLRYFQVNDLLVFVSRCQTGCLTCKSATYCKTCDWAGGGYYLNPVDHLCYLTCPQATFKDDVTYFLANAAYPIEHWCSACPATCLQCTSLLVCTICYPYGRNQSFLFIGTTMCINPCINGYRGNYTTHICVCPTDYFYEDTVNFLCIACAAECVNCNGPTSLDCQYCEKGYYLAYQTTHCLLQCPVGQYENNITRTCFLCDSTCTQCKNEATQCTQCMFTSPMKYLLGQECLTWCPAGYSWENVTHRCEICAYNTYSFNGKCVRLCPSMYQADRTNRSCIHYSETGYIFDLSLISVSILSHGKLMKFQILAQDGLNSTSYEMVMKRSYYNAKVVYKDTTSVKSIPSIVRNLMDVTLSIKNIQYSNNRIYYYTQLPSNLDYRKSFQIVFLESIAGSQNIYYNNLTNVYSVSAHPQLMKSYYSFTSKNSYNIFMIPFIVLVLFLFTLQLKGVYDMYMELLKIVQMLGLLVYSSFPIGQNIFYFLLGCSYANLDFIPNLYAMAATPESVYNFSSYNFTVEDMDFIRLNGSVLLFGFIWTIVIAISKFLIKVKEKRLDYMMAFGLDLMEVKILHSFWSALIFVIINYNATNFSVFATFSFAFAIFLGVLGRRYAIWKETNDYSPLFFWRLLGSLFICFISLANELLVSLVFCLSIISTIWQFYLLHSNKYLINITDLNSDNYMSEKTYRILNSYDEEIRFCWAVSIRNTIITITPIITSLLISILILMKESEIEGIIFTTTILYFLLLLVIINSVFVFFFLDERRKYLVQNKLEYLQKKYAKLNNNDTIIYEERKRPRLGSNMTIADEQKFLEQNPARSMMKNID